MADETDTTVTLDIRFVPDAYTPDEIAEGASWPLGAGKYYVGAVYKGAFLPLAAFGGGKVDKLVGLAAQNTPEPAPATEEPAPAATEAPAA